VKILKLSHDAQKSTSASSLLFTRQGGVSAQFNSYVDSHQLVGCLNKVRDKILCDFSTQNINLFDVVDVENALAADTQHSL